MGFPQIDGKSEKIRPNPSAQQNHTAKTRGLNFLDGRIRPHLSDIGKIRELNDFSNCYFFSHFSGNSFSWISTESDVLWCKWGSSKANFGVLSHHLHCEMKSPHLVDFS